MMFWASNFTVFFLLFFFWNQQKHALPVINNRKIYFNSEQLVSYWNIQSNEYFKMSKLTLFVSPLFRTETENQIFRKFSVTHFEVIKIFFTR